MVNHIRGFFFIFPVPPVGAPSGADRQADLDARLPPPIGILDNLFTLALGAPSQDRTDKPTGEGIVDVLGDRDDLAAVAFNLFKDHGGVDEVAREAAQVKDDDGIGHTVTDKLAGEGQLFA